MPALAKESTESAAFSPDFFKTRSAAMGVSPDILASIYSEEANIVVWQRALPDKVSTSAGALLALSRDREIALRVTPASTLGSLNRELGIAEDNALGCDIAELVDMFCCLFELKHVGLRLTALTRAMCPRFHVDSLPCRLVTTYRGTATEWLPHDSVDRSRLGTGNQGKPDSSSGLYRTEDEVQQLSVGDVALLKGELWEGNENAGLVHRSPAVPPGESRLLLTLDIIR